MDLNAKDTVSQVSTPDEVSIPSTNDCPQHVPDLNEDVVEDDNGASAPNGVLDLNVPLLESHFSEEEDEDVDSLNQNECYVPKAGMVFSTWSKLDDCIRNYGRAQGFGILRCGPGYNKKTSPKAVAKISEKDTTPNVATKPTSEAECSKSPSERDTTNYRNYLWKCESSGKPDRRRTVNGRKINVGKKGVQSLTRKSKKCDCPVKFYATVDSLGKWKLINVILQHENHQPKPGDSKYISQYRQEQLTPRVRRYVENAEAAGVPLPQIHRSLGRLMGGLRNMAITKRDLRNMLAKGKKLKLQHGDATAMLAYFKRMSKDNNMFFHMERYDQFERLKDVMWVDARSRAAYEDFGDVVTFDSTYITNKFHLPFANFVGVNHHGQSVLLGCALISREDSETFEWLFSTWLECMGGKAPAGILTDQCAAMRKALSIVMPESRHRWCLWHILQKLPDKLKGKANYDDMKEDLLNAIYDTFTPSEFETKWEQVIQRHNLVDNEWLHGLYLESEMWVPTYMKHMFWAGMRTTQRSESVNSFFKGYVTKHTKLYEFADQYFCAMESRVAAELEADAESARNIPDLVSILPFESIFRNLYTNDMFYKFQDECAKFYYVNLVCKRHQSATVVDYVFEDRIWVRSKSLRKDIPTEYTREYVVTFDEETKEASCVCKFFESHGIMCRHQLRVYDINKIKEVPGKYILRRWRKDITRKHSLVKVAYQDHSKNEEAKRYNEVMNAFESLGIQSASSERKAAVVLDAIRQTSLTLLKMDQDDAENNATNDNQKRGTVGSFDEAVTPDEVVKDPLAPKRPKHRTTNSRYKSATEKNCGKGKGKGKGKGSGNAATDTVKAIVDELVAQQAQATTAVLQQMQMQHMEAQRTMHQQYQAMVQQPQTPVKQTPVNSLRSPINSPQPPLSRFAHGSSPGYFTRMISGSPTTPNGGDNSYLM